jgi:hypothetical protein
VRGKRNGNGKGMRIREDGYLDTSVLMIVSFSLHQIKLLMHITILWAGLCALILAEVLLLSSWPFLLSVQYMFIIQHVSISRQPHPPRHLNLLSSHPHTHTFIPPTTHIIQLVHPASTPSRPISIPHALCRSYRKRFPYITTAYLDTEAGGEEAVYD